MGGHTGVRTFATKNDSDAEGEPQPIKPRRKRRTKAEIEEAKAKLAMKPVDAAPESEVKKTRKRRTKKEIEAEAAGGEQPVKMYVLKFNSPILPYAKFPLTHNKYIQEFIKMYEEDKDQIDRVIGVHFPQNNNSLAEGTVGIEIKVTKKNSMTMIESNSSDRYRVDDYDPKTNFCQAIPFADIALDETFNTGGSGV